MEVKIFPSPALPGSGFEGISQLQKHPYILASCIYKAERDAFVLEKYIEYPGRTNSLYFWFT